MDENSVSSEVRPDGVDYKKKWEEAEKALRDFEYRTKIGAFVKSLGLKNDIYEKYVADLCAEKNVRFDGDKPVGAENILDDFRNAYPEAFAPTEPVPEFSVNMSGRANDGADNNEFVRAVMGLK